MAIRLIAIDLDGTLLDTTGRAPQRNLDAIAHAARAGVRLAPCTGRSWPESRRALTHWPFQAGGHEHEGVFVNGSIVCTLPTGVTTARQTLEPELAHTIVQRLAHAPNAVLVFCDGDRAGHDYLVTGRGELTPNTRWWFELNGLRVAHRPGVTPDDLTHTLRVGMVGASESMAVLGEALREELRDRVDLHHFVAVQMPGDEEDVHLLEVFAPRVNKWTGVMSLAQRHGIAWDEIAVIGDQINDLAMFENSHCRIAMGNAVEPIRALAHYVAPTNDEAGVAHAIEHILAGHWDAQPAPSPASPASPIPASLAR